MTPGKRVWLAALLPLVPVVLALAVQPLPHSDGVVVLDGPWRVVDGDVAGAADEAFDDSAWTAFTVPGPFNTKNKMEHGWVRKHFALADVARDLFVMVPNIRGGFARVFVNGRLIGEKGVPESGYSLDASRLDGFAVPHDIVKHGDNVLALELIYPSPGNAFPDPRFFIGPPELVKPYLERSLAVKALLEYGAMMVTLFGLALIAYLYTKSEEKALYRSSLMVMTVVVLYLAGKTGVIVGFFFHAASVNAFVCYTIIGIAFATPELIESYYVGSTTLFRKVNRVVCAAWFAVSLVADIGHTYTLLSPWLFVVIVHALIFAAHDLARPRTAYGPVLASAVLVTAVTGAADVVSDLNVLFPPRLFSYGVANLGVIAIVLAFGDFLRLQTQLHARNLALADALKRAEETSRLKSEFLANTSHELRTPLNAIINIPLGLLGQIEERSVVVCASCGAMFDASGDELDETTPCPSCDQPSLSMEIRRFAPDDGDALSTHLRAIIGSGEHLLAVVNDILDFSKLAAGKMEINKQDVALEDVVQRAISTLAPVARAAGVTLRFQVDASLRLQADPTRITQVLINLVANAVKFSPPGAAVDVEGASDGGQVVMRVIDRGVGIAAEHHALIFESFRQIEGGHTRKHGGTGLGLAIVKQIVDMHGGTVDVDSAVGKGSTFRVKLPR